MEIKLVTVILTIINTVILYFFLRKYLFVPVTSFMNNRNQSIAIQLEDAEKASQEVELLKTQYEKKISESLNEGKKIIDEYKSKALTLSDDILKEAKLDAERIRERARIDAERERERVRDEVRRQIITLSLLAASKSVGEQINEEKHHVLIKEFINKVGV